MSQTWRNTLWNNRFKIALDIGDNLTDILYCLYNYGFLTKEQLELYFEQCRTEESVTICLDLINKIHDEVQEGMPMFVRALMENGLFDIASFVEPAYSNQLWKASPNFKHSSALEKALSNMTAEPNNSRDMMPSASLPNLRESQESEELMLSERHRRSSDAQDEFIVAPHKICVKYNDTVYGDHPDYKHIYKNSSLPRGLVFIANFKDFGGKLKTRHGSEVDMKSLILLFTQMGYVIAKSVVDADRAKFIQELNEFRDDPRHKQVDSCIVIIMSHGYADKAFYTRDCLHVGDNDVLEKLNNSNCPNLSGKPKIFIYQHCRGDVRDYGIPATSSPVVKDVSNEWEHDGESRGLTGEQRQAAFSDMYIIHSTIEGYTALRNRDTGSILIDSLCCELMNNAYCEDLNHLMILVKNNVTDKNKRKETKQVPEMKDIMFRKRFYFNPVQSLPPQSEEIE